MTRKHRKPKPMSMTPTLSLEQRIKQLRAEIDTIVDAKAEAVAKQSPGVPLSGRKGGGATSIPRET